MNEASVMNATTPEDPPLALRLFVLNLPFVRNLIIAFENGTSAGPFALTWALRKHRQVFFSDHRHSCTLITAAMQTLQHSHQSTRNTPNPEPGRSSFQSFSPPSETVI